MAEFSSNGVVFINKVLSPRCLRFACLQSSHNRLRRCNGCDDGPGKPDPWIVLRVAAELRIPPRACLVVEDAPTGVRAARAASALALGVARSGDAGPLRAAGACRVVSSLDEVDIEGLTSGLWMDACA